MMTETTDSPRTPDGRPSASPVRREEFDGHYATFGVQGAASLDAGIVWPTSFAATKLTTADEKVRDEVAHRAVGG